MNNNNVSIGNCGEYYVAAELERNNFTAAVPMSNTKNFDILAIDNFNSNNQIAIQVKTTTKRKSKYVKWMLNKKSECMIGKNIFYVFVVFDGRNILDKPDYYIVPSELVAQSIKQRHIQFLSTSKRNGEPHKDTDMREFIVLIGEDEYKNNWNILRKER